MKQEVSPLTLIVVIVLALAVMGCIGWFCFRGPGEVAGAVSDEQKAEDQAAFDRGEIGPKAGNTTAPTENAKAEGR